MKITKSQATREDWDNTKSWNYKLTHISPHQSVVYAEVMGDHGEVHTNEVERIYFIIEGEGEFIIDNDVTPVTCGDVLTIPPHTTYNYHSLPNTTLKIILLMELWKN